MLSLFSFNYFLKSKTQQSNTKYWYNLLLNSETKFSFFFLLKFKTTSLIKLPITTYLSKHFNIYFLKKEVYYTKLKYSRVPAFDTASGAVASFLSALFGFMVCEKFGFELLDGGDFLFLILYVFTLILVIVSLVSTFNTSHSLLHSLQLYFRSFK